MARKETYNEFVEKFKPKKTTDDCYTPPAVYDVVLNYVKENCDIEGLKVLRPFYPGGDYENVNYTDDCVVIDNPPFSMISKIIRFYLERNIKFFLFAPHLTLFSSNQDFTAIVASAAITYENGAKVTTSFVSNMFGNAKVIGSAELHQALKKVDEQNKINLPKYNYPDNIVTVSRISSIVELGENIQIDKNSLSHSSRLDCQKKHKKAIFGSGFLASDKVSEMLKNKERIVENKKLEKMKDVKVWRLSDRERNIINQLG